MVLLAALLRNYPRGKCLIDIGTEGFEFGWLQGLQYFLGDGGIEQIATEAHAAFACQTFAV